MNHTKILFTGASGFIGSHFHQVVSNNEVVNLDLIEPKFIHNASFIKGDIRNKKDIEFALSKNKCDTIVNLAAEHKDFGVSYEDYFKTNEFGTKILCPLQKKSSI